MEKILLQILQVRLEKRSAQGVLGSNSLIVTLDDLKKIVIDIKVPENYVGILKPGLKAEIINSAFNKTFKGRMDSLAQNRSLNKVYF